MTTDYTRSWLLWAAGSILLLLTYYHIFVLEPVNSDTANALLAAQNMAAGNWRLHGWFMAPDNYLGLDEVSYALIWRLTDNAFLTLRLVPALQWTGLMMLATYLGTRHERTVQSLAILSVVLLVPVFGPMTGHLYFQAPFHIPTTICMLLVVSFSNFLLTSRRPKWLWASLLAIITIDASFSDPFFQFILTIPLLLALWLTRSAASRRIAILYLVCVVSGMVLLHVNTATGGFTQPMSNVPRFIALHDIPAEIGRTMQAWLGILGYSPADQPVLPRLLTILRIPLVLLLLLPLLGCVRRIRTLDFIDLCLLLIVGANLGAVIVTSAISDVSTERYLLPAWVCAAILAAKFARKDTVITAYCLALAGWALGAGFLRLTHAPEAGIRFSAGEAPYIAALRARGLTRGYAGYWQASDTTVATGGEIKIRTLVLGKNGKLGAYDWFARKDWYNGAPHSARFFVSTAAGSSWPRPATILATFGTPDAIFVTRNVAATSTGSIRRNIETYIYDRPLPAMKPAPGITRPR